MLRIVNGTVYDPIHGVDGEVREVCVWDGLIVAPEEYPRGEGRTIDATGMIIMPGGVDIHCHIAGPKVNLARKMHPEAHRSARPLPRTRHTRGAVASPIPSTFATGYMYAGMGYTVAMDAAVAPLGARHAHEELADTPVIDKGFYVLMGNNHFVLEQIRAGQYDLVKAYVAWLLGAAQGHAVKIVNPGGTEAWKFGGNVSAIDQEIPHFGVTPRQVIATLAQVSDDLGLPHPVHIHCNNLGVPGNWETTLATMRALEGRRAHLTHLQFHSYGGDRMANMTSRAPALADYINSHPNLTCDVGQVVFGAATTMTADGPFQYLLYKLTGHKWSNFDIEAETGCGVVPYRYRDRNSVNALQWAIGLELFLLIEDPWRVFLTTDHPNGGSFVAYPRIIKLLMSREARREAMAQVDQRALSRTVLPDLDREYSLYEIAIITRAGPARRLGLARKGHLGAGAHADITIYDRRDDIEEMFSTPRYVIKDGVVVVEEGQIRERHDGRTLCVAPDHDPEVESAIRAHFERHYTVQYENYPVDPHHLPRREVVPCASTA